MMYINLSTKLRFANLLGDFVSSLYVGHFHLCTSLNKKPVSFGVQDPEVNDSGLDGSLPNNYTS